jgi:hypothetical protein
MRNHYWTISSFADWVRGTPKLKMGTSQQWAEWRRTASGQHPVRYWLAEEGLDYLQKFVCYVPDRLNDIRYYVNNRWVSHAHSLTAHPRDIKPGQWQDVGNRFLPCLFNELVDFVEVELAWHHVMWDDEEQKKYAVPWHRSGWLRWRTWRCPRAGIAHLEWATSLTFVDKKGTQRLSRQAMAAKEIMDLYYWWTEVYPNRPNPHDASGWTAYCELSRLANGGEFAVGEDKTPELRKASRLAHKELRRIEAAYEKEDESMMIRLIKIRQSLWT